MRIRYLATFGLVCIGLTAAGHAAEDKPADKPAGREFSVADGKLLLKAPVNWKTVKPENGIVEHEFSVPPAEGDEISGRVTVMGAGGTVDANIQRWFGQFTQPDGSATKDKAKVKKSQVAGEEVHWIDISGTFSDKRGPFNPAPAAERPKYRMLAAIISSKKHGNYFVKFYGPERTVTENEKAFVEMIAGLKKK